MMECGGDGGDGGNGDGGGDGGDGVWWWWRVEVMVVVAVVGVTLVVVIGQCTGVNIGGSGERRRGVTRPKQAHSMNTQTPSGTRTTALATTRARLYTRLKNTVTQGGTTGSVKGQASLSMRRCFNTCPKLACRSEPAGVFSVNERSRACRHARSPSAQLTRRG